MDRKQADEFLAKTIFGEKELPEVGIRTNCFVLAEGLAEGFMAADEIIHNHGDTVHAVVRFELSKDFLDSTLIGKLRNREFQLNYSKAIADIERNDRVKDNAEYIQGILLADVLPALIRCEIARALAAREGG